MINLLAVVFVVGILVFVHEFGHFLVAKMRRVRVEKFSLGFGPEIIGRKIGSTRYILSLIPLGGYIKMAGENPEDERKGEPDEYLSKRVGERMGIVASGPLMNIILCIVILAVFFNLGLAYTPLLSALVSSLGISYFPSQVGTVLKDSAAEKEGLKSGDIIEKIDGRSIEDWAELTEIIHHSPDKLLKLKVKRGEEELEIGIRPRLDETNKVGLIGIIPHYGRTIGKVPKDSTAYKGGLRQGDEIIEVSGNPVSQWNEIIELIEKEEDNQVSFSILRHNDKADRNGLLQIELSFTRDKQSEIPLLDFQPAFPEIRFSTIVSIRKAFTSTFHLIKVMYEGLWKLVSRQVSIRNMGGPILIAQISAQAAKSGFADLFIIIAVISVNLAVLNLLPIPVLDGGHIMFLIVEGISGKPVSKKKQEIAQQIGIAIIVGLMLVVIYNDVLRLFQK